MTTPHLADAREAADIAAFLARLLRWDKAAVVRIQAAGGVLAVFGHPPFGGVLAIRTAELAAPVELDATVSAGQLLDAVDSVTETAGPLIVPASVTGPAWAGLLPPRGGWRQVEGLPSPGDIRAVAVAAVVEFRTRTEQLPSDGRTRAALDSLADAIWARQLGTTVLPLRAVHAAHALGFLRPARIPVPAVPASRGQDRPPEKPLILLASGPWLRLRTPYGSVAVRRASAPGSGLGLTPLA